MKVIKRLFKYLKAYRLQIDLALFASLIFTFSNLSLPWLLKNVIVEMIRTKDKTALSLSILALLGVALVKFLSCYARGVLMAYVAHGMVYRLRNDLFKHLQQLSLRFYHQHKTGQIISRFTNDVLTIGKVLALDLVNLISDPLILLGAIGLIFLIHWKLALYTLIIAPFAIFFTLSLGRRIRKLSRRLQETLGGMTSILQEVITGIKIVKAFAMEQAEIKKFNRENKKFFQLFVKADKLFVLSSPLIELLGALGVSFICWYGGCEVIKGNLSLEMLLVFMVYLGIVSRPIRSVSVFYQQIQHVITCGERIFRILDTPPLIIDKKGARDFKISAGGVEFEKVYFRYQEEKGVLYDINLKVTPGETVAIVGPSGSGKTTLVDLIPRFYEITSGQIKIDGVDIREMKINSLRNQISIVPQEVILFDGTVEENIRYGFRDASFEEIVKASQIANAHSFITKLKDGYRTRIGERGVKLSGGEKQRIAIARAIIKKPAILILDEATSNLDSESEKLIQAALLEILKNQTTFIIAHRISTVINADKIIVLHHGRMVEEGTHQELMKNSRLYKKLYSLQFEEGIEMVEDSF